MRATHIRHPMPTGTEDPRIDYKQFRNQKRKRRPYQNERRP